MKKLIPISFIAASITLALFGFMAFLIDSDDVGIITAKPTPIVEVAQTPPPSNINKIERVKPIAPPPVQPRVRTMIESEPTQPNNSLSYTQQNIVTPAIKTDIGGSMNSPDMDARPIVRVNPKYPVIASNAGTEGWVKLAFSINEVGAVFNVKVLDSKPKRIFDRAAKQALKKWKYRAKQQNGKPIIQENLSVQLDFTIDQQS